MATGRGKWSLGAFGAMGLSDGSSSKSAIRLENHQDLKLVAFETISSDPASWNHAVALCLPEFEARMSGRKAVTSLGCDVNALRDEDRRPELFDLGLGYRFADICLRTRDEATIQTLRRFEGRLFTELPEALGAISMDHVFVTQAGRIEMFGQTGLPPLLPSLLKDGKTHAATSPIPKGFIPCGYFFPPHPLDRDRGNSFDPGIHTEFQKTLRDYGLPHLHKLKERVREALENGEKPGVFSFNRDRFSLACIRVTLRQQRFLKQSPLLDEWQAVFEKASR
ncbi:hypothetical protein ABFT80_07380 [Mesorhizobium sp. SB112]|uniref:DUF6925 family protein n=1 Tax=Mesorhizobium sp. SB112 TaxID=3151853 RepID=UPI0032631DC2